MAQADAPQLSYNIRDFSTYSVTISPHNAQIVRILEDIVLEPGQNRIEILGLSPTVDEGSVKIDGHGKASISGVTVESTRNPEHYQEIYESDSDDDLDQPDPSRLPEKPDELQKLEAHLRKLRRDIVLLDEEIKAAQTGTQSLRELTTSVGEHNLSPEDIALRVEKFQNISRRQAQEIQDAEERKFLLLEELSKATHEMETAQRAYMRDTKDQRKQMERAEAKWQRTRKARKQAKKERFEERAKFWPRNVYKITVMVEHVAETLGDNGPDSEQQGSVSLSLYYVTNEASWTPAYDISVDSESTTGTLIYRAEISNQTSETWKDAQVTLSTSQTSFKGLRDPIPELNPWHLRLQRSKDNPSETALISSQELVSRSIPPWIHSTSFQRSEEFGVPHEENPYLNAVSFDDGYGMLAAAKPPPLAPSVIPPSRRAASANVPRGLSRNVGSLANNPEPQLNQGVLFGSASSRGAESKLEGSDAFKAVSIPEAAWEESGLTAVWDLKGRHTINPSSKRHRHRIAMIDLSDLRFKHVCVPKLRSDAFLTMRLHNHSDQTILPGDAGLTLDGAFLGTTTLKRIAPGDTSTVSLGVDETIVVEYTKPTAKRNITSGLINRDASTGFQRCVTLRHTKSPEGGKARPVEITVHDQIPVPMDERIRFELIKPRGLQGIGDKVSAGEAIREATMIGRESSTRGSVSNAEPSRGSKDRKEAWGHATASLNKDGKIEWEVKLSPGQKVALPLEYEVKFPAGEILTGD